MIDMQVNETKCKSTLSKSKLKDSDYSINPYRGCENNCVYCYAPYIVREQREWGTFVDAKTNAAEVLAEELKAVSSGNILLSSVTDPYQDSEKKFKITRAVLGKLNKKLRTAIQTKSVLVLRDIDLIKKNACEVGMTITTLDEEHARKFEPGASKPIERLDALSYLKVSGVKTFIFFGPFLPFISDIDLEKTISRFALSRADMIHVDKLNIKGDEHWAKMKAFLDENYPGMAEKWQAALSPGSDYYAIIKQTLIALFKKYDVKFEFRF
jgi:DNA repair photolyase